MRPAARHASQGTPPPRGVPFVLLALVAVCVPVVVTLFTAARDGNADDMAVLRALARLVAVPELAGALTGALGDLPEAMRLRYTIRFGVLHNYPLCALLTRLFEAWGPPSAYFGVLAAHALLKAGAVALLLGTARRALGAGRGVAWALVLALAVGLLPGGHTLSPLGISGMLWYQAALRSTALPVFAAALLLVGAQEPGRAPVRAWVAPAGLGLLAASLNVGFAALLAPALALGLLARRRAAGAGIMAMPPRRLVRVCVLAVLGLTVLGAGLLLALLGDHAGLDPRRFTRWIYWVGATLGVCLLWRRARREGRSGPATRAGDFLVPVLLAWAGLVCAANVLVLDRSVLGTGYGPALAFELVNRSSGLANMLLVVLLGLALDRLSPGRAVRRLAPVALACVALLMPLRYLDDWRESRAEITDPARLEATLAGRAPTPELLADEVFFFHALANDLRREPDGATVRDFCARAGRGPTAPAPAGGA
ncbi:hypothetical protein [Desulfocurvus sp.]|uniref:hypothetical protein n=1 Tax=Desulfocurvus sp. TaxID=2871698 RepID=UPI0025C63082|nr:hypothetical protein [Desulfocurvus sp.]